MELSLLISCPQDYPGGSEEITQILKKGRGRKKRVGERYDYRRMVKEMECHWFYIWRKGAMSQGRWEASRSWERQRNRFFPKLPEKNAALLTPKPDNVYAGLLTFRRVR